MNREDVIKVDQLKTELSGAFRQFEQRMTGVFGELVYGIDTVIERYNDLERKHEELAVRLGVIAERLLTLEQRLGGEH